MADEHHGLLDRLSWVAGAGQHIYERPDPDFIRDLNERRAELRNHKTQLEAQLTDAEAHAANTGLLDELPIGPFDLDQLPDELTRELFEAIRLQIHYDRATNKATCSITLAAETINAAATAAGKAIVIPLPRREGKEPNMKKEKPDARLLPFPSSSCPRQGVRNKGNTCFSWSGLLGRRDDGQAARSAVIAGLGVDWRSAGVVTRVVVGVAACDGAVSILWRAVLMTTAETTIGSAVRRPWGDRCIRWTTTASVVLLAAIAAVVSYRHMHTLTLAHGESAWTAALIPLSVDGMIIASSMTLLADSRAGSSGGPLPWALLAVGSLASLAANMAVAEPTAYGRVIAAWPSFALIGAYELLMRQIRQAAAARTGAVGVGKAGVVGPRRRGHVVGSSAVAAEPRAGGRVSGSGASRSARGRGRPRRLDDGLLARARVVDAEHRARYDRPASAETLRVRLRVGARSARALKDLLRGRAHADDGSAAASVGNSVAMSAAAAVG